MAGEMSGHLFFADRYFGFDDAIYAAVRLLELVSLAGGGLRELLADVPRTASTPEIRVPCAEAVKRRVVATVAAHFRARYPVLEVDGARIDFGDDAWGLCRASNTGPVLVLRFEAKSPERCDEIRREVEAVVARAQQQAQEQA
jgi:phosphomannomutase/phosphoglucomutase